MTAAPLSPARRAGCGCLGCGGLVFCVLGFWAMWTGIEYNVQRERGQVTIEHLLANQAAATQTAVAQSRVQYAPIVVRTPTLGVVYIGTPPPK